MEPKNFCIMSILKIYTSIVASKLARLQRLAYGVYRRVPAMGRVMALLVLFVLFQSRSGGPGSVANLQVTGAPGSTGSKGTCANAGCHTAGAFDPSQSIELLDGTSPVTEYEPGKSYVLRIVNTPGTGTPARFGFQAVALNSDNMQAGDWGDLGSGKHTVTISGRKYVEHSAPATSGQFEINWIAPPAGTGQVTFYAASIAANGNASNSGDGTANGSLSVAEKNTSSTTQPDRPTATARVLNNPVATTLPVELHVLHAGHYTFGLFSAKGEQVLSKHVRFTTGIHTMALDVAHLPAGVYYLQVAGPGLRSAHKVLVQ